MDPNAVPTLPVPNTVSECDPSQDAVNLGSCLRASETKTVEELYNQPTDLINTIVPNLFVVTGIILLILGLYAGYKFIDSGTKGKEQAVEIFKAALVGLVILFCAFWVVQIVEVILGQEILF